MSRNKKKPTAAPPVAALEPPHDPTARTFIPPTDEQVAAAEHDFESAIRNPQSAISEQANPAVILPLDLAAVVPGYAACHLDGRLTPRQAAALKVLWQTLSNRGLRFTGGRGAHEDGAVVDKPFDGVRWLLDQVADAIEFQHGVDLVNDLQLVFR